MTEPDTNQCDIPLVKGKANKETFDIRTAVIESLESLFNNGGVGRRREGQWEACAMRMDGERYVVMVNKQ